MNNKKHGNRKTAGQRTSAINANGEDHMTTKPWKRLVALLLSASLVFASVPVQAGKITRYVHTDHLGSVSAKTDSTGVVMMRRSFTPYGENEQAVTDGPGYTGHYSDTGTGLVYMQARYYDPVIGRFLSVDPVTFGPDKPQQFNRYWYANGNPYLYADPNGKLAVAAVNWMAAHPVLPGWQISLSFGGIAHLAIVEIGGGFAFAYSGTGQVSASAYGNAGIGFGLYAGFAGSAGISEANLVAPSGLFSDISGHFEANAGDGLNSVGVSGELVSTDDGLGIGIGIPIPKAGVGIGAQGSVGLQIMSGVRSKPLFQEESEDQSENNEQLTDESERPGEYFMFE